LFIHFHHSGLENSSILLPHRFFPPEQPGTEAEEGLSEVAEEISEAAPSGVPIALLLDAEVFPEHLAPRLPRFPPPIGPVPSLLGILVPPVVM
jgi:hypothetical protein